MNTAIDTGNWVTRAACAGTGPDLWHPTLSDTATNGGPNAQVAAAKKICHRCPVRTDCLDHAITNNITHGIWGGLTPKDRRTERARRRRTQGLTP